MNAITKLPHIDLFSGILGFSIAAEGTGRFKTTMTSEIDSYCNKLIDQKWGLENAGSVESFAIPAANHPDQEFMDQDLVPCEETGFTSLCLEDFYEGAMEFPFVITGGFPCVDLSSANTNAKGIDGEFSSLVKEQIRIISALEPKFCIFENSALLVGRGLDYILKELSDLGYIVEWETLTAAAFGFPHYRHRCYIVAYLPTTHAAKIKARIFEHVRMFVPATPQWKMPLNTVENSAEILERAVTENPRSVKLRTKRINALGNSIIPDIARAIFNAIIDIEDGKFWAIPPQSEVHSTLVGDNWILGSALSIIPENTIKFPPSGCMSSGQCITPINPCRKLNPTKTQFKNMFSTLIKKDGNNNFSCRSRATRPGKLGGLIGEIIHIGADIGGLNPEFGEEFMGYEIGHTELIA
jgi:site-specific DNA-cytosine methylase